MAVAAAALEANYVGGEWVPGTSETAVDIINPANQQSLAHIALASETDTVRAIEAAAAAFPEWRMTPAQDRIQYMFKFR
jgi:malonate-semialdehyde dehydrogenase (acetylating)/methylmalonate-semialdehyde dehydrogenase